MKVIQLYKLLMGGGGVWRTFWSLCSWSNLILDIGGHRSSRRKESHSCLGSHAGCTSTLKSCKYAAWSHSSPVHCRLDASGNGTGSNTCSCKSCDRKNMRGSNYSAATPPTKPAVAYSFQHHPPLFESFKKEKLSLSNRKAHLVMGNRVQDFAESISVSSLRLLKLYVVKTGKAFNFKLNLGSGVLGGGETCDLNRIMLP